MKELMGIIGNSPDIPENVRERHNIKEVAQQFESIFVNEIMKSFFSEIGISHMHADSHGYLSLAVYIHGGG